MTESGTRILVVEDQEQIRALLGQVLARHGYRCETASNVAEARKMLNGSEFDLLLSDVNMPSSPLSSPGHTTSVSTVAATHAA